MIQDEKRYARFLTEIQESSDKRRRLTIHLEQARIINENYEKSKLQSIVECNLDTLVDPLVEPSSVKPSVKPLVEQSVEPSVKPSVEPSVKPMVEPSVKPSVEPSVKPMVPGPSILPDSDSKLKYLKYKTKYINLKMRTIL